ncbi:MAG: HEAT repeat domain-containing protein [Pseudomonadota bacterium]
MSETVTDHYQPLAYTTPETLLSDFVSRGLVVLGPDSLGVTPDLHQTIFDKERELFKSGGVSAANIPELLELLNAPGLVRACNELLGEDWAIVPYTHNAPFMSGSNDQHWHKDDNGPFNGRKQRHHHAVQIEMLYYPQTVLADMGPTATVPYSQYWTFNHEENHDNFAGADHLDFDYQVSMEREPISGPRSQYSREEIVEKRTRHDIRMRDAVLNLQWPLCRPFEAGPLDAGSVVLYSHNLIHRGNHRRDEFENWKEKPRFMWRFWLYRTRQPNRSVSLPLSIPKQDDITGLPLQNVSDDVRSLWRHQYEWSQTGRPIHDARSEDVPNQLAEQLRTKGDQNEPQRVGAAYRLAALGTDTAFDVLENALHIERENVRRAATYGLIACGEPAAPAFLRALSSPVRWLRKAGCFGYGECGTLTVDTLAPLRERLLSDSSVYVRSVAAVGIGTLGRRASVTDQASIINDCVLALLDSLAIEENRVAMDKAQGRSIKLVRPDDDSDVCEGIGIDYGLDRFDRVRSAPRENALWSLVILCTHATHLTATTMKRAIKELSAIVEEDRNVFCAGSALDAISRLGHKHSDASDPLAQNAREQTHDLLCTLPLRSWEPMLRSGVDPSMVNTIENKDESEPSPFVRRS